MHVALLREKRSTGRVMVGKPVRKKSLRKLRRRWPDNTTRNLKGCRGMQSYG